MMNEIEVIEPKSECVNMVYVPKHILDRVRGEERSRQEERRALTSVGPEFDFGAEAVVWGDEKWGVTTYRVLLPGKQYPLWLYDEGSYNYTSAKICESTFSGYAPSLLERLQGQKHIPPRHERELEIRAYSRSYYDTDSEGNKIPDPRKGWVFACRELGPQMELLAKHTMERVESHRAAHAAYMAQLKAELEFRAQKADEVAEEKRLASIRNLPRISD